MSVHYGGCLYEQLFIDAPLRLLTQILWHLVQTPLAALPPRTVLLVSLRHYTRISSRIGPLYLLHNLANYRGNAALCRFNTKFV